MSNKKIKNINEFLNNDFEINIDNSNISQQDLDETIKIQNENLKKISIKNTENITIERYRNRFNKLIEQGKCNFSNDELDSKCLLKYGEPFFKK
jgi:hypothetical protein